MQILIAALIAVVVIFFIWMLRGVMLTPVKLGRYTELAVRLRVSGPEPRLEETVSGLLWLRENGTLPVTVVIEDAGMDDETRAAAKLMAKNGGCVRFRGSEETEEWEKPPETSK